MSDIKVPAGIKSAEIQAVVIRANGSREELGTIAYWHKNPIMRVAWHARRAILGNRSH